MDRRSRQATTGRSPALARRVLAQDANHRPAIVGQFDPLVAKAADKLEVVLPVDEDLAEPLQVLALLLGVENDDAGLQEALAQVDHGGLGGVRDAMEHRFPAED